MYHNPTSESIDVAPLHSVRYSDNLGVEASVQTIYAEIPAEWSEDVVVHNPILSDQYWSVCLHTDLIQS